MNFIGFYGIFKICKRRMCASHRPSQRSFKLSANYDHRLDAKASSTGLRKHWILKAAKYAHKVCELHTCGSCIYVEDLN